MKHQSTFLLVTLLSISAQAQYKCVDASRKVLFQQTPCPASHKQQELKIKSDSPADRPAVSQGSASGPQQTVEQRMVAKLERERRVRELEQEITRIEQSIADRPGQMDMELAGIRRRKMSTNNNLAGATLEQSLSGEMQAITQKYKVLNDSDFELLKQLRSDLSRARGELK